MRHVRVKLKQSCRYSIALFKPPGAPSVRSRIFDAGSPRGCIPMSLTLASRRRADALETRPALFCFSHLRWDFVWQRPQHLLTRAAQTYDVFFFEEPVRDVQEPVLEMRTSPEGVHVAIPHLPADLDEPAPVVLEAAQRHATLGHLCRRSAGLGPGTGVAGEAEPR